MGNKKEEDAESNPSTESNSGFVPCTIGYQCLPMEEGQRSVCMQEQGGGVVSYSVGDMSSDDRKSVEKFWKTDGGIKTAANTIAVAGVVASLIIGGFQTFSEWHSRSIELEKTHALESAKLVQAALVTKDETARRRMFGYLEIYFAVAGRNKESVWARERGESFDTNRERARFKRLLTAYLLEKDRGVTNSWAGWVKGSIEALARNQIKDPDLAQFWKNAPLKYKAEILVPDNSQDNGATEWDQTAPVQTRSQEQEKH